MIQIDMPMPDNCLECRFNKSEFGYCNAMPVEFVGQVSDCEEDGKPEWCPLKANDGTTVKQKFIELADAYGLTVEGVQFALEQYQTVICEITHSRMSKLSYFADDILRVADEVKCAGCELQEPCEDAVSKQAVISALEGEYSDWNDDYNVPITHCIKAVQSLPSVQPVPLARVMTLEEVAALSDGSIVWLEDNDKPDVIVGLLRDVLLTANDHIPVAIHFATVRNQLLEVVTAMADDYGIRWRCWTSRPSDAQRKATPW